MSNEKFSKQVTEYLSMCVGVKTERRLTVIEKSKWFKNLKVCKERRKLI